MNTTELLRSLFGAGKHSTVETSKKMGRSRGYLSAYIAKGNVPQADNLAEIMDAIGFDLLVRNRETGEEIAIDPPSRN